MRRVLFSGLAALAGTGGVLGLVVALNSGEFEPPPADERPAVEMQAHKEPPKKKKPRKQKPPPKRKQRSNAPPPPSLGAGLAGLDLGLPGFDMGDLADGIGATDNVVMTAESVDEPPRALETPAAAYPTRARGKNIEGYVKVSVLIGIDGRVMDARVVEASPEGVFDDAALQSVRQWSFSPAMYQGAPTSIRVTQTIEFKLS